MTRAKTPNQAMADGSVRIEGDSALLGTARGGGLQPVNPRAAAGAKR